MFSFVEKFLNTLKLNVRINLFISALLMVVFTGLGYWLYTTQKKEIFNKADKQLSVLIEDLVNILEVQTNLKKNSINSSMHLADKFFTLNGGIKIAESTSDFKIQGNQVLSVKNWILDSAIIQQNDKLVKFLQKSGVEVASIYQKTEKGYLLISTTLKFDNGRSAVGTIIPHNTNIVKTIEKKETYDGRAMFITDWYFAEFSPILIDGQVAGMLAIGAKQLDYNVLKPIFYNKTYFESGYPYVVSHDGFSVINKSGIEGKDLNETSFFRKLKAAKENGDIKFRYKWPETEEGQWKWTYLNYFEPLDIYVATSVFEYELYSGLDKIRDGIIGGVIISVILFFFGITLIISPITNSIQKLVEIISTMARGKLVNKIEYEKRDEIGDIIMSLNTLISGLRNTAIFSNEIGKGNFDSEFTPLSKEDTLGNSLLAMRQSLKHAKEEERKRKEEDELRKWATDGLAEFNELVHQNVGSMQKLCDLTLSKLVRYINANQGGIFILNDEIKEPRYELISSYAYNRKKFLEKQIALSEGLVGSCAIEKETIYMTDVPDDYVEIESGLGTANPKNILIVPIKLDEQVLGVVELASFSIFQPHVIAFVEKFAENFASTLNTVKINTMTKVLLQESESKSYEMKMQEEEMRQNLEVLQNTQEIAQRKQTEMEGILKALDTSFLVCELEMNANIVKVNNEFLELFKLSHEEVTEKGISKIFNRIEDNSYLWAKLKEGKAQKRIQNIIIDNNEYWLSETYTPIFDEDGIPYKVLNIAVDITSSKKQELEIQQLLIDSERKAEKLFKQERLNTYNLEKLEKTQIILANKEKEISEILNAIDSKVLRAELDRDSRIININQAAADVFGFKVEDIIGESMRFFIEKIEFTNFDTIWEPVLKGNSYENVIQRTGKNGKSIWLLISYSPIKEKDGSIKKVLFIGNDISKQKLSEERTKQHAKKILEKSKASRKDSKTIAILQEKLLDYKLEVEGLLRILNKTASLAIYSNDGTLINITDFYLKKLGKTRDDLVGTNHKDLVEIENNEQRTAYKDFWTKLNEGKPVNEINFISEKNRIICISDTYMPVKDAKGQIVKIVKISNDITQNIPEEELQNNMIALQQKLAKKGSNRDK